ncbi:MAG: GBS Bsp-like repeat-containing protein [Streptococcus minor]|nr:GBS Bsp-like repeat-containing protein [Streptococcus minor]
MKFRKWIYLAGLFAAMVMGQPAQADTIVAEPAKLTLQGITEKVESQGQLTTSLEEGHAMIRFTPQDQFFQSVKAKLWSLEDRSDLIELSLKLDEEGEFVADFQADQASGSRKYFLEIEALTQDNATYLLKDYTFEWLVDTPINTTTDPRTTTTVTTSQGTSSETTSVASTTTEPSSLSAVQEAAKGNLTFQHNVAAGTFDVVISNVSNTSGVRSVKLPVWTDEGGQDDIQWYTAHRQANGTYKVTIHRKNHKNGTGLYHVHLYYEDRKGKMIGVTTARTSFLATGKISIQHVNVNAGTFDIIIREVSSPHAIKSVRVPVWTDEGGQDDIRWYTANRQADGTYKVSINKKNHKNGSGQYHVHLYYDYHNAPSQGITATQTTLAIPTTGRLSITNQNSSRGSFDIIVSNVKSSKPIKAVKIPVWTEDGGQDDIRWYVANRQADGTYKATVLISNHKNGLGIYQVHLYYEYSDGQVQGVATTKASLANQGSIKATNLNQESGSFDLIISNILTATPIKAVKVPVWTEEGGQDDIKWYTAIKQSDGTYKVHIQKSNHKNGLGVYQAHLYYELSNGQLVGIAATTATLNRKSSAQLSFSNVNRQAGTFDILISKAVFTSEIQSVQVPVWTEAGGQDDLRWYTATKQNDGNYRVTVDSKNHKNGRGVYEVHLYFHFKNGKTDGITSSKFTLPEGDAAGKLTIRNQNQEKGTFDIVVSDIVAPKGLDAVQVPVWSEKNGQDDIQWYLASRQADGTYKVTVEASNHKYDTGSYHIHLYLKQKDGSVVGVAQTKTAISISQTGVSAKVSIQDIDNTYGYFNVVVSNIFAPAGVTKVQIPVWSSINGQNDIIWYEAYKQSNGNYYATIRLGNHKYETGVYNAHVYIESNGRQYGVGAATANVTYTKKTGQAFIDISSHNGYLSVADYNALKVQGVYGVVVKLTEGTSYFNPYAPDQIKNAQAAGLKVSVYHYSHFTSASTAQAEARYFVDAAKRLGLSQTIVMVNDIEEYKSRENINANMKAWEAEMRRLGYNNLIHYTGASWIDNNNLGYAGPIRTGDFGLSNFWVAQYPYINGMPVEQARRLAYYAAAAAWQFTSRALLLQNRPYFDLNIDYTGRFTQ